MSGFDEVRRLAADLNGASGQAARRAGQAIGKAAYDVEALGKRNAPVDTGFLRNSIGVDHTALTAVIGPTAHYGPHQEFGTAKGVKGKHYMGRAADVVEPLLGEALAQLGIDLISKGG